MPSPTCPICHNSAHPVLVSYIPKGRSTADAALYRFMKHSSRRERNVCWHDAIQSAVERMFVTGTGYIRVQP